MSLSEKLEAARVALGKRKERELQAQGLVARADPGKPASHGGSRNKMLAGHLAHEFLTRGTLLGRRIEPSRGAGPAAADTQQAEPDLKRRYTEVSCLLMSSGAHIPGVVNPTQLARWLQIKE